MRPILDPVPALPVQGVLLSRSHQHVRRGTLCRTGFRSPAFELSIRFSSFLWRVGCHDAARLAGGAVRHAPCGGNWARILLGPSDTPERCRGLWCHAARTSRNRRRRGAVNPGELSLRAGAGTLFRRGPRSTAHRLGYPDSSGADGTSRCQACGRDLMVLVIPTAFAEMLRGANFGKALVRVLADPALA